ncbi:DUF3422 family protein [Phyllobacterium sp. OV277]|uniref:DUF3422 family protein n=1 Tax=Phyllobacterium sp. OV277 TaxID=1882772 RepID=UPI00088190BC|nr:DUF3422 family protein [Phyllobacterium sp. OV277]SDP58690.1 Uncharacterized membrane-anchored protein [Phyllobacterium sp. OV277]
MKGKRLKTAAAFASAASSSGVMGFPGHAERSVALGEVHARPYPLVDTPRLLIQLAFMTEAGSTVDHAVLAELSRSIGITPPARDARHHIMPWGNGTLRWERHTEFSTYLWEGPVPRTGQTAQHPFGHGFNPPGTVIDGVRLEIIRKDNTADAVIEEFDPTSLCYSDVENGLASIITDFRQDKDGMTRILILDNGLSPARAGALSQRVIEIETYRTLAMLGLPLAHSLSPRIRRIEDRLAGLTTEMRAADADNHKLLDELTLLAAELEADAASSLYRFGASRAYDGIVLERLAALHEESVTGYETWAAFIQRRMAPAMRTCYSVSERQENLSEKLSRAATLLRTSVDVELERQNRDLLSSMNRRAQLQLRLQRTVEGLSVAAISYYVVGLFYYLAKGVEAYAPDLHSSVVTAAFVPVAIIAMWFVVKSIRKSHKDE